MPTAYDIWFTRELAKYLGWHPLFDLGIQSLIAHDVLGGFWFAASLFVFWMRSAEPESQEHAKRRIWTIFLGSMVSILLTLLASTVISGVPPSKNPILAGLYPDYLDRNPNANSFPSQSSAVYSAVAAGIYSLSRKTGLALWLAVGLFVALPRIYVGGHYLSDVLAGFTLGLAGYWLALRLFEPQIVSRLERASESNRRLQELSDLFAFFWILQVAVEFRDLVWLKHLLQRIWDG